MSTDLCVVHNEDAKLWPDYVVRTVSQRRPSVSHRVVADSQLQNAVPPASASRAVVVILSPGHLDFLRDTPNVCYQNCQRGIIFLCGVDEKELCQRFASTGSEAADIRSISDHFPNYANWVRLAHNADSTALGNAVDSLLRVRLLQPTATSEGPTTIAIAFDKPVEVSAKVEIMLSDEGGESLCMSLPTERINPQTYTFIAPEHREGNVTVKVIVDGNIIASSLVLTYTSMSSTINDISQIYMHLMSTMCTLLQTQFTAGGASVAVAKQQRLSAVELDEKLSSLFDLDNKSIDVPTCAFEKLFGIYQFDSCVDKEFELPTLIHFAAKFGLNELCAKLVDLPDANLAFNIGNRSRKRPHDIALAGKHTELARFLQNYQEVDQEFESLYVSYYNETGGRYQNTKSVRTLQESHYMPMNCSGYVRKGGQLSPHLEQSDELYVDPNSRMGPPPPTVAPKRKSTTLPKDPQPATPPTPDNIDVNMPPEQRKLIEIMNRVKRHEITLAEAEELFHEIQSKSGGGKPKSFKEKQEHLLKMKEDVKLYRDRANKGRGGGGVVQSPPAVAAVAGFVMPIVVPRPIPGQRISNTSLSSRDSAASRASRASTSGIDSDPEDSTPPPRPALPPRQPLPRTSSSHR